jgi:hypothetical protein
MLERISSDHFSPLIGQTCHAQTPMGEALTLRVETVKEHRETRPPESSSLRVPFTVTLTAREPTRFTEGCCRLQLATIGCLEGAQLVRVASLGRDPTQAYFQIVFN